MTRTALLQHQKPPWSPDLTFVSVQDTPSVKDGEINVLHSISIIISNGCSSCHVFRDAKLARYPRLLRGVVKGYYHVKHTMGPHSHTGSVNMMESRVLWSGKEENNSKTHLRPIGHFWVGFCLCVKRSLSTNPFKQKLVQSLNSPFFPPHIGAEPGRAKEESRITCMRMLRTPPFFPPNRGKNHIW